MKYKFTSIIVLVVLIFLSCESIRLKDNSKSDSSKNEQPRFKVYRDTATWIDGKVYQFFFINRNFLDPMNIEGLGNYYSGSFEGVKKNSLSCPLLPLRPKQIYLIEDFRNFGNSMTVHTLGKYGYPNRSAVVSKRFTYLIKFNFNELKDSVVLNYPESDTSFFKKWSRLKPELFDERENTLKNCVF